MKTNKPRCGLSNFITKSILINVFKRVERKLGIVKLQLGLLGLIGLVHKVKRFEDSKYNCKQMEVLQLQYGIDQAALWYTSIVQRMLVSVESLNHHTSSPLVLAVTASRRTN